MTYFVSTDFFLTFKLSILQAHKHKKSPSHMAFLPINPSVTKDGSLFALIPKFGIEGAKIVPLDEDDSDKVFVNFNVVQESISTAIASTMKISPIFGGELDFNDRAYYFDAIAYTDKYDYNAQEGRVVLATRWGVGLRIVLKLTKIDVDIQFNLGSIGAAVQLGKVNAKYEIKGIGLGIEGLNIVLSKLSPIDDFSYDTYLTIKNKVIPELAKYIQKNKKKLVPQPIAVEISEPITISNLSRGHSVAYAITQISRKKSLTECLKGAGDFQTEIIEEVYDSIVGKVSSDDSPSDQAIQRAKEWIRAIRK